MIVAELLILEELIAHGIITTKNAVQDISFDPPKPYEEYECSIRVADGGINSLVVPCGIFDDWHLLRKYCIIGNYINIFFNTKKLAKLTIKYIITKGSSYGFSAQLQNSKIAIEHTSMTPVYPINIATFRSSVIGNALKSTYEHFGASVTTHFFVEDMARNLSLLQQGLLALGTDSNIIEMSCSNKEKPDNFLGKLFVLSYYIIKREELLIRDRLDSMFLPSCLEIPEDLETIYEKMTIAKGTLDESRNREICNICVEGHKQTMRATATMVDAFDYETTIVAAVQADDFKDISFGQALLKNNVKLPYSIRNLAYFSYLQRVNDKVISVISRRQKGTLDETLDSMKNSSCVEIVYFGDVLISDDDESNVLDVIKHGVFHSVDQYIEVMSKLYNLPSEIIIAALKFKMLGIKTGKTCNIDDSAVDQYYTFIDMLQVIKTILSDVIIPEKPSETMVSDDDLLPLIILLLQFEEIPHKSLTESSFHLVVKWIYDVTESIVYLQTCDISIAEKSDLNRTIKIVIQNAFRMLGINITTVIDKIGESGRN